MTVIRASAAINALIQILVFLFTVSRILLISNMAVSIAQGWQKVKAQVQSRSRGNQRNNPPMMAAATREPKPP